jgi:hypothetical protein
VAATARRDGRGRGHGRGMRRLIHLILAVRFD